MDSGKYITLNKNESLSCTLSITSYDSRTHHDFQCLPERTLKLIFSYLDEQEVRLSLTRVCKIWRQVAMQPEFWSKITFSGRNIPTNFICSKLRMLKPIKKITVIDILDPIIVIRQICLHNSKVEILSIKHCGFIPLKVMNNVIKSCSRLKQLNLSGTEIKGNQFYREIPSLIHLKSINLSGNKFLSKTNLSYITLNCRQLEEFKISHLLPESNVDVLTDYDVKFFLANLQRNLKSLSIDASSLTNRSCQDISKCKKLEKLCIYNGKNLSGQVVATLCNYLPKLQHLKICNVNQFTEEHIKTMCSEATNVMQNLILIDLTGCWRLNDGAVNIIAEFCNNLQAVILKSCKLITNIKNLLQNCIKLENINVAFCKISFASAFKDLNDNMKKLVIDKKQLSKDVMDKILERIPGLKIYISVSEFNKSRVRYFPNKTIDEHLGELSL